MDSRANFNRRRTYQYEKPAWEVEKERAERERREAQQRNMQQTEDNFPVLGRTITKTTTWGGRKFNELAAEWKDIEDKEKAAKEGEVPVADTSSDAFVLPVFRPSRMYVEEEEETPVPDNTQEEVKSEEDGWVTVDRSLKKMMRTARKEARINERLRRLDDGEELEDEGDDDAENQEETCWNGEPVPAGKEYTL